MVTNSLLRRVAAYGNCELSMEFNIDFAQFSPRMDVAAIAV